MNTDNLMSKLFRWTTTVEYNSVKFYIRIVGDAVIDDARRAALLESRKLRKDLRNPESENYLIYLDPLNDLDDDTLRDVLTNSVMRETMREYMQRTPRPVLEPLGNYPTQEQQEQYETDKETQEQIYLDSLTAYIEQWQEGFVKTISTRDRDFLLRSVQKYQIDRVCEDEFTRVFENHIVACSIYSDDKFKTRMFTIDQYCELPTDLKKFLRDTYNNINISQDDIKN